MIQAMTIIVLTAGLAVSGAGFAAKAGSSNHRAKHAMPVSARSGGGHAVAVIHPTEGNQVHGLVHFDRTSGGMRITAELHGLPPDTTHGFHIHEYGDCSAADASSAGGHYNPGHHRHAGPHADEHHAGDLGNIKSDADGDASLNLTVRDISVDGRHNPVLGRAVIVHAGADDLKSQPSGDAGDRIGCGVIGLANME